MVRWTESPRCKTRIARGTGKFGSWTNSARLSSGIGSWACKVTGVACGVEVLIWGEGSGEREAGGGIWKAGASGAGEGEGGMA
jgi:hypothetical protein